jgi:hypothetical protein
MTSSRISSPGSIDTTRHHAVSGAPDGALPVSPPGLATAIRSGLEHLTDLRRPPATITDGRVEAMLRASLDGPDLPDPSMAAVRTACAHLAAAEYEDAYLALRTAKDHLPRGS